MIYKSDRIIDGKRRKVIVDENGKIINTNPSKEELKCLGEEPYIKSGRKIYTDNELLEYLRRFHKEIGRIPIVADFDNDPKYPSRGTYANRFGSWNNAIDTAGLWNNRIKIKIADDELLKSLRQFYEDTGKVPAKRDFINNPKYPGHAIYQRRFGSWQKALKLVGLDIDSTVRKGILENTKQKGRLFEIYVLEHFTEDSIDIAGDNCTSPFDGICPKGQIYDAKSTSFSYGYWTFKFKNAYRYEIEWFYLEAFDKDYKKLLHVWRISGDFIAGQSITIGINKNYKYNVKSMKKYEITEKFKDIDIFK